MSEEEKRAINNMKLFARVHQDMTVITAEEMDIVLKLVERLQRENEDLKEIEDLKVKNNKIKEILKEIEITDFNSVVENFFKIEKLLEREEK